MELDNQHLDNQHQVFIALGSNIEPREKRLREAVAKLQTIGEIVAASSVFETTPVGYSSQPNFYNGVVEITTNLEPRPLIERLRKFETELGRTPRARWHEREIDFDILFYEDLVIDEEGLIVPHPELQNRKFVLVPLVEIAPNYKHPVFHRTVGELLGALNEREHSDETIIHTSIQL